MGTLFCEDDPYITLAWSITKQHLTYVILHNVPLPTIRWL